MQISWDSFKAYNQDSRGLHFKFEDLCRQLFVNENLIGNKQYRYLHANPNNFGLETEPIYDEKNQRWIGFQAKYFDSKVDYRKIKESFEKVITYYTGKAGCVDLVYLYCNQQIKTEVSTFMKIKELLNHNNIRLGMIQKLELFGQS